MWWPSAVLAVVMAVDAVLSIRPPRFVQQCYDGVGFPRRWWWALAVAKVLAVAGLLVGHWRPDVGLAAHVGVVAYFVCAAVGHVRAGAVGRDFRVNCLGMLAVAVGTLVLHLVLR